MTREVLDSLAARLRSDPEFRQRLLAAPRATLAAHDLTEEERLTLILPNFGWVVPGQLAGSARPLSDDALDALARHGVRALVNLAEEPLPDDALRRAGLIAVHLPVADFTAPTLAQVAAAVGAIDDFQSRGLPVAVHCTAGLGRTGTILACQFVGAGMGAPEAIAAIRAQRPGSIETTEQEAVIAEYERQRARGARGDG